MASHSGTVKASLAAAACVAAVAAGTAVVQSVGNDDPAAGGQGELSAVTAESAVLQSEARVIFDAFNGTRLQNDAAGVLHAWALNGAMDTCMAGQGFAEWDWSAARHYNPEVPPLSNSIFFAEPLNTTFSDTTIATARRAVAEITLMGTDVSEAEAAAITACGKSTPETSDDDASEASQPSTAKQLRTAWWELMYELDDRYGDTEAYSDCFAKADLSVLGETGLHASEVEMALSEFVPGFDEIPASPEDGSSNEAWQRLLAAEREVAEADWACRADTYNAHLNDVRSAVADFAAKHADEIDQAQLGWAEIESRAAKLGFDSTTGELAPH